MDRCASDNRRMAPWGSHGRQRLIEFLFVEEINGEYLRCVPNGGQSLHRLSLSVPQIVSFKQASVIEFTGCKSLTVQAMWHSLPRKDQELQLLPMRVVVGPWRKAIFHAPTSPPLESNVLAKDR
eukprot:scaffold39010_cov25-Tisochrysis_lutea.AAC.2